MPTKKLRTRLRFTPGPPTREALKKYPLWCMALDEEERPGQDESTIRPSDDQERIDDTTAYAAAIAKTPSGETYDAMMESDGYGMNGSRDVERLTIWIGDAVVEVKLVAGKIWSLTSQRAPFGFFDDRYLPLEIRSVSAAPNGRGNVVTTLLPNGQLRHAAAPRKRVALPPIIRPSDVPTDHWPSPDERTTVIMIDLSDPAEPVVSRSQSETRTSGAVIHEREDYHHLQKNLTTVVESEVDARSLQLLSHTRIEHDGTTRVARSGSGGVIPDECFFGRDLLVQRMPLAIGWAARIPVYHVAGERVDYLHIVVEAMEPAPRQPESLAWRVRVDGLSGSMHTLVWYDVETRHWLASRYLANFGSNDKLLIREDVLAK